MNALGRCPGPDRCRLLDDVASFEDRQRTLRSSTWRWHWLTEGLPAEAAEIVAPFLTEAAVAVGSGTVDLAAMHEAIQRIETTAMNDAWHRCEHLLSEAGRAVAAAGAVERQEGAVSGLFAGEGLPKQPLAKARVGRRGIVGDVQRDTKNHGRPTQALCVWSADVVDALVTEGHPIAPGAAGENVSVRGIDWAKVRPGSLVRIGDLTLELTGWALPCAKNRRWFLPGPEGTKPEHRIDPDLHPGWARIYAYVLTEPTNGGEATIGHGDPVIIE